MDGAGRRRGRGRAAPFLIGASDERTAAAAAALVHIGWRPIVGLGPVPDPDDPIERVLTQWVLEHTLELRQRELDYMAFQTARLITGG